MKKMLLLLICLWIFVLWFMAEPFEQSIIKRSIKLHQLIQPDSITIDTHFVYITEKTTLWIFDGNHFKLKRKIGKKGEGPQEFLLSVMNGVEGLIIDIQTDNLLVNSLNKLSFFKKTNGEFSHEIRTNGQSREFKFLGDNFVGQGMEFVHNTGYRSLNIYDSNLRKIKEVIKVKHHFQMTEGLKVFDTSLKFITYGNKLFVAWDKDFIIPVYNEFGQKLYTINHDFKRMKVSEQDKKNITRYLKASPKYKGLIESLGIKLIFPLYFPALMDIVVNDDKIYTLTTNIKNKQTECFIFTLKGIVLKKVFLNLVREFGGISPPYPYTIKNNILYQLVEKGDNWYLHKTSIH